MQTSPSIRIKNPLLLDLVCAAVDAVPRFDLVCAAVDAVPRFAPRAAAAPGVCLAMHCTATPGVRLAIRFAVASPSLAESRRPSSTTIMSLTLKLFVLEAQRQPAVGPAAAGCAAAAEEALLELVRRRSPATARRPGCRQYAPGAAEEALLVRPVAAAFRVANLHRLSVPNLTRATPGRGLICVHSA